MTTPVVLTGATTAFGTAIDNTGTDSFLLYGAGNTVVEGGGNLVVNAGYLAPYGWDTNSTILLGNAYMVNDAITLDGGQNTLASQYLYASTVNFTVTGLGGNTTGSNIVSLDNSQGTSHIKLTGTYNNVTLNGDATNTIVTGGAHATVNVGTLNDDDLFGYTTSIKLTGGSNSVTGGDENFTISGGGTKDTIHLGDGNNTVKVNGKNDTVSAWGGTNIITAGGGNANISFLGTDGQDGASFVYDPDDPIAGPPTDTVNIVGANDAVTATYENVVINGSGVTGSAKVNLGVGNNTVTLGGNSNSVNVGDGDNSIFLTGNSNAVTISDTSGVGKDAVTTGNGSGDVINFGYAGGSVNGTGSGTTTVVQSSNASTVLNINMNNGTLLATVGNGSDTITANGAGTNITAGYGNDTITANGGATIFAGDGNDLVYAQGNNSSVTLGSGSDVVYANGNASQVSVGNGNDYIAANGSGSVVTAGYGNDTISATGAGSAVTVNAQGFSQDNITVGSNNDFVRVTDGTSSISGVAGDTFYLNGLNAHSTLLLTGNGNMAFIGDDSNVSITLNQAQNTNGILVQADPSNTYSGEVDLTNFNLNDTLNLEGLVGGVTGQALNSYTSVLQNITAGPVSDTLHLAGGGSIVFSSVTGFTSNEFIFGTHTGSV